MSEPHQFSIHYTREEAKRLLPQVADWLQKLAHLDGRLQRSAEAVGRLMAKGQDRGGPTVEEYLGLRADTLQILNEFQTRQIFIKDLERGIVDFPAIVAGREVFLCWERGEDDIEFWHDIDGGYAGRERL
jgi:hypothetical protein